MKNTLPPSQNPTALNLWNWLCKTLHQFGTVVKSWLPRAPKPPHQLDLFDPGDFSSPPPSILKSKPSRNSASCKARD